MKKKLFIFISFAASFVSLVLAAHADDRVDQVSVGKKNLPSITLPTTEAAAKAVWRSGKVMKVEVFFERPKPSFLIFEGVELDSDPANSLLPDMQAKPKNSTQLAVSLLDTFGIDTTNKSLIEVVAFHLRYLYPDQEYWERMESELKGNSKAWRHLSKHRGDVDWQLPEIRVLRSTRTDRVIGFSIHGMMILPLPNGSVAVKRQILNEKGEVDTEEENFLWAYTPDKLEKLRELKIALTAPLTSPDDENVTIYHSLNDKGDILALQPGRLEIAERQIKGAGKIQEYGKPKEKVLVPQSWYQVVSIGSYDLMSDAIEEVFSRELPKPKEEKVIKQGNLPVIYGFNICYSGSKDGGRVETGVFKNPLRAGDSQKVEIQRQCKYRF